MSNTMVGSVYQKIMDEVIENCIVTFEEDGVERRLLDEVKKTWQNKLSERRVALMPWDPAPPAAGSGAPSQGGSRAQQSSNAAKQAAAASASNGAAAATQASNPPIKTEPQATSYDLQNLPQANGASATYNTGAALDRASQHLQDRFGAAANPQISQLQARRAMAGPGAAQYQQQGGPPPQQQAPTPEQRQKMQMMQQQQQQHQAQQQQQRPGAVGNGQTDGAAEWAAYVAERRAEHALGGADADASLRDTLAARIETMEGGGVFEPVSARAGRPRKDKRVLRREDGEASAVGGRFDGPDSDDGMGVKDEEADEDAINSDLDDSADELPEEAEEDADKGEIMLCTYDKVQRVKNKWKCTLKDGVLTTGGKEYVFHKAQGEFEW